MEIQVITTIKYFQKNVRINQLKNSHFFHSIIMSRLVETKIAKETFYAAKQTQ